MHWDDLRPLLWSAVGGGVATMVVGFGLAGWMTAGSAEEMAGRVASASVVERLAPMCMGQASRDPEQATKLVTLKATDSWRRGDAIAGFGWATMPGDTKPDTKVSDRCAEIAIGTKG